MGGKEAEENSWPWQVMMRSDRYGGQFCGGSLIKPSRVVTAAHCVEDIKQAADITVRLVIHCAFIDLLLTSLIIVKEVQINNCHIKFAKQKVPLEKGITPPSFLTFKM